MDRGLDEVWRSVREMLGTAARDSGPAIAAFPERASGQLTEAVRRFEEASEAPVPNQTLTSTGEVGRIARPSTYVPGRDLIDEVDYAALRKPQGSRSLGSSPVFEEIQRIQGFNGRLAFATREEIDAVISEDRPELFRGFEADSYMEAFLAGSLRSGGGTTGNGFYVTSLEKVALSYTHPNRRTVEPSRLMRMALHPEARVVKYRDLKSELTSTLEQVERETRAAGGIANPTDEDRTRYFALLDKRLTFGDIGQYGALRGYDAIESDVMSNGEWNILNPTALLIQR
ncbi:hypothetical protein [Nocardia testacea]|uniref:hypothetical protein n=1 Tax=Nocardia testacea TaxID=248551 RepID=UPI003A8B2137